jgi:thiol-disulfide isomerase/thioredoxin/mono/diheme cytochrome c family protein
MRLVPLGFCALLVSIAAGAVLFGGGEDKPLPAPLGTRITDFTLPRVAGGPPWSLVKQTQNARAVVVLFLGTECPVNNAYAPTLAALHKKYDTKGVVFLAVNSNQQDDAAAVAKHARDFGIPFPVLKDDGATVADHFRAERVPEAFVLDGNLTVRYRGRIDDQFGKGVKRPKATRNDLAEAIDDVLAGKTVAQPVTEVVGCPISRPARPKGAAPKEQTVTYSKRVARILQDHCQTCHRPGEIGPFKLMTYRDAAVWSDAIREAVSEQRMPPWHADPGHGRFANDRRLSDADRQTLLAWIDQGCAEGDAADLPSPRHYTQGWGISPPDEIITVNKEIAVPAEGPRGGMPYKYVLAGRPFTEERWVRAAEVRPGNRSLVHHINVYVLRPGRKALPEGDELDERLGKELFEDPSADKLNDIPELASYAPGDQLFELPAGMAKRIPKGSRLVFEMHYVPNGKARTDRSSIGLVYAKEPPRHEVFGGLAVNWAFLIPPGAANHCVTATARFDQDSVLLSLSPHMHLRGKSFEFCLVLPDGKRETLLSVPKYDFSWQTNYILAEPRRVPKGSKLECTAHFDNSSANLNNPNPKAFVIWGDQTWNEMMLGYFDYYHADAVKPK